MPEFDDDDTGQLIASLTAPPANPDAPVTQEQAALLQKAVARFVLEHAKQATERRIWRGMGSLAAATALSVAGYALTLAQQASADHDRLDRVERVQVDHGHALEDVRVELRSTRDELMERGYELTGLVQRLEASVARLEDIERERDRRSR